MSRRSRCQVAPRWARMVRLVAVFAALAALLAFGFGGPAGVRAQNATATPTGKCKAPKLPPGTPTPHQAGSPVASTPVAAAATPVPTAAPAGTAADEATAKRLQAAVRNLVNCFNNRNDEAVAALLTGNKLMAEYGSSNPYDAIAQLKQQPLPSIEVKRLGDVKTYPDGRVSIDLDLLFGGHWFQHLNSFFVKDGKFWKLDEDVELTPTPEGDTSIVGIAVASKDNEYLFAPNVSTITQKPVIIFHAQVDAAAKELHEMVVVQLPKGKTIDDVLKDPALQSQVKFFGVIANLKAGDNKDLALINLEPGTYTLVCFLPAPDGQPHVAHGMHAEVKVVAPSG